MKIPFIEKLHLPELIHTASHLVSEGKLAISDNNLVYLDVESRGQAEAGVKCHRNVKKLFLSIFAKLFQA